MLFRAEFLRPLAHGLSLCHLLPLLGLPGAERLERLLVLPEAVEKMGARVFLVGGSSGLSGFQRLLKGREALLHPGDLSFEHATLVGLFPDLEGRHPPVLLILDGGRLGGWLWLGNDGLGLRLGRIGLPRLHRSLCQRCLICRFLLVEHGLNLSLSACHLSSTSSRCGPLRPLGTRSRKESYLGASRHPPPAHEAHRRIA